MKRERDKLTSKNTIQKPTMAMPARVPRIAPAIVPACEVEVAPALPRLVSEAVAALSREVGSGTEKELVFERPVFTGVRVTTLAIVVC
jgi:hypothetical protein